MSEWVTRETCPGCGAPDAAVGWTTVRWVNSDPVLDVPEEFDCPRGCEVDRLQVLDAFLLHRA
jgi:hypothetical protein